mmetsp:Transcript_15294/g.22415  ORF Transcript_15294/g.22415 Transcript_15294/m.22415 type:complete len:312 (+) Transcript_15294:95-1030(+)|eukprot:CAMPEP_0197236388 /NCGR_PEP_ID=MMETSP1429-20130617/3502_1 /TAXON_ID=49237 /ORGANISM="Chaetoceros  sp., Strain UNC1202" /LENGTH=311 /DNA_ID=CAMNT_0042695153 /DNA_START=95 /DNA_END=1030 /DNA_ORIENTATION=-
MTLFELPIATIFTREVLEASLIIGQYRTVIQKSDDFDDERRKEALKAVNQSALLASLTAAVLIAGAAIGLYFASKDLEDSVAEIIEGVSKVVAAICILQLSTKCPKWLGLYASKKISGDGLVRGLSIKSIKFNVSWNLWREVAEVGAFLLPFFLGPGAEAIPVSAVVGIIIGLISGGGIYYAGQNMKNTFWLAFFLAAVTGMLSVGLFTGGCHKLELALGETKTVWTIQSPFWSHEKLPMTIIKPFGYSSTRTVLQMCCFWSWFFLLLGCHYYKYKQSQKIYAERADNEKLRNDPSEESPTGEGIDKVWSA